MNIAELMSVCFGAGFTLRFVCSGIRSLGLNLHSIFRAV